MCGAWQSAGFETIADKTSAAEKWLDILYAGFCAVKENFDQEEADALIDLGRESCCLYPGEMMQAAVCLENGGNAGQILAMIESGDIDVADLFSPMPRKEAEKQTSAAGTVRRKSVPAHMKEKTHWPEHTKTAPQEGAGKTGNGMAGWKTQAEVAMIRKRYPVGSRIELDYMNEEGMPPGLKGIVKSVDDAGALHIIWENGRSLALVPGADRFHRVPESQAEKQAGEEPETEEMEH